MTSGYYGSHGTNIYFVIQRFLPNKKKESTISSIFVFKRISERLPQRGDVTDRNYDDKLSIFEMSHKVFVYGTLKRNEPNHNWLTHPDHGVGKFVSEGKTKTKYPLIIATKYNIPFLLYSPGDGHHVKGEVYEIDDTMLSKLDILEDHPNYYVREIDDIIVNNAGKEETEKCWVYFLKNFRPELLAKEQFENYTSEGSHGLKYLERSKRDPNDNFYPEVKR